ncbi:CbtA family protein [Halorubrum sp. SD626R]|uniref:CbtA family protein n=1 Tax=Halorubrum sp. SD626R TaxID=1419722 RepID=UPI000AC9FF50|nr:CbtA family protein [Halorubrum sp. SD626R]TKX81848.1 cobalamin cluster protein [Halorubrum sp. SD626R]
MIDRIRRGIAAGAVAGAAYGLFTWLVLSPAVGYLEHAASHEAGHGHGGHGHAQEAAHAVSEATTALVSAGGGVLWGVLLGAAFGAAYYLFEPALPGGEAKAYVLAGAGFLAVSVAPWTVLPPVVPGMEQLYGPGVRVPLYLGLIGVGALVAATSVLAYDRASAARGRRAGAVAAALPLVALALLSALAPPTLAGGEAPAELAVAFRWLVALSQAGLWALIAVGFRRFERDGDRPAADSPAATPTGTD